MSVRIRTEGTSRPPVSRCLPFNYRAMLPTASDSRPAFESKQRLEKLLDRSRGAHQELSDAASELADHLGPQTAAELANAADIYRPPTPEVPAIPALPVATPAQPVVAAPAVAKPQAPGSGAPLVPVRRAEASGN